MGNAVTGAIWANLLPGYLRDGLSGLNVPGGTVEGIYGSYFNALTFAMGTPERDAINKAYSDVYRIQLIVACCAAVCFPTSGPPYFFSLKRDKQILTHDLCTDPYDSPRPHDEEHQPPRARPQQRQGYGHWKYEPDYLR